MRDIEQPLPSSFRLRVFAVELLVIVQVLLGMAVNLFVRVPTAHPGAHAGDYFTGVAESVVWAIANEWPWLAIHALFGLGLVVGATIILVASIQHRRKNLIVLATIGAIGIIGAGFNGGSFLFDGGLGVSSYLMTVGAALVLSAYTCMLYFSR